MIRPIVRDAFKIDDLVYQFETVDVDDGLLISGTPEEVSEKYSDDHIVGEAENWLDCTQSQLDCASDPEEEKIFRKEYRKLSKFIAKYR